MHRHSLILAPFYWSLASALQGNAREQPQSLTDTICAGRPRTQCEVELDVPQACATDGVASDPSCPIVFFLHGSGGTNNWFRKTSGVHDAGMIGVYPQGEGGWNTGPKSNNNCHWSDFECTTDPDEGDFIASIVDEIRSMGGTGNVYASGNSNGAALAHRLASNSGTRLPIRGIIVSVTQLLASPERSGPGTLNYNQPSSSRGTLPVSILSIMGDADPLIPYEGGSSSVFNGDENFQLMPTMDSMAYWASHNGCDGSYQTSQHTSNMGNGTATKYDYSDGCPDGIFVEHYAIHGGLHNAGGAAIDGKKVDILGFSFVARIEAGGNGTPSPVPKAAGCDNDDSWSGKFNAAHTCEYVAQDPANRCFFENSEGVRATEACPGACNPKCITTPTLSPAPSSPLTLSPSASPSVSSSDCENDPDWVGKFNDLHTCDFVAQDSENRCHWENSLGITAEEACPGACDSKCSATLSPVSSPSVPGRCENDLTWSGKYNTTHTCDYIALDPANRCFFEDDQGVKASEACPGACDSSCTTSPTASPTASCQTSNTAASKVKIELQTGQDIHMFEVQVISNGVNISPGKAATQSSTFKDDNSRFGASNAIDQNELSFSHTDVQTEGAPVWWEIALGEQTVIDSVVIMNRWCKSLDDPNKCLCRLTGAQISLIDNLDNVVVRDSIGDTCGESKLSFDFKCSPQSSPTSSPTNEEQISCLPKAQKIKLQSITGRPIHMYEVEVISAGANIALGKSTSQSSDYNGKAKFAAGKANDGIVETFSHTGVTDPCSWWEIDLERSFPLESIKILNRWCSNEDIKGCLCRLSHVAVTLFDETGEWVDTILIGDTCGELTWLYEFSCLS